MHTLVFLSTRQVLQCQPAACQALPLLPRELLPLLFKVAFMDKKTVVLRELVHTWPFPLLSFQQLLQECAHCSRALLRERPSTESVQAVIRGLTARLHTPEAEAGTRSFCRKHALRVLDMTSLLDDGVERDPGTMSMWDCTAAVARTCVAQQQGGTVEPGLTPAPVEVRVDLRVNRASYAFLREALQSSAGSPLRLCCRDLRAEDLPMRNMVALLQLLDAGCLRRVDLRFNNLGLRGLSVIIPHVAHFQCLASLRLHYVHGTHGSPPWMARKTSDTSWPRWAASPVCGSSAWAPLSSQGGWTSCSALCRAPWRVWSWPSVLCCLRICTSGTQPPRCPPQEAGPEWQRPVWQPAGAFPGAAAGGSGHTAAPRAD